MARSNIILTGGINHDFDDMAAALSEVLAESDFYSEVFSNIDDGFQRINDAKFDLITLFTLRWRMLDDDKYMPDRQQWAYEISERDRRNLQQHVTAGGGLLAMHTTAICFDTWPAFSKLIGGKWAWGKTFHPPPANIKVNVYDNHPFSVLLEDFSVTDEVYHNLHMETDSLPLLTTNTSNDGSNQLLAWANHVGSGRVVYDSLGHDRQSICEPGHAKFLQTAANWCCGDS